MQMIYDHNAIENRLIDPELEPLRVQLFNAVETLMSRCAQYGIAHQLAHGHYELAGTEWVRDNPPEGVRYERFEAQREELGGLADGLVHAYDALMSAAQPRLPSAFDRS
jgi:hypothetical protein